MNAYKNPVNLYDHVIVQPSEYTNDWDHDGFVGTVIQQRGRDVLLVRGRLNIAQAAEAKENEWGDLWIDMGRLKVTNV